MKPIQNIRLKHVVSLAYAALEDGGGDEPIQGGVII